MSAAQGDDKGAAKETKKKVKKESAINTARDLAEKKRVEAICNRQRALEAVEINQTWNIVFGNMRPKKKKEIHKITNVTLRNLWLEEYYIYNKIREFRPDEIFHAPDKYCLQWQPPGISYKLIVPLDDPVVMERTILRINELLFPHSLLAKHTTSLLFYFCPYDPSIGMFAPPVHPSSLLSFRSKVSVLHKLCEMYVAGHISLDEFNKIMACSYEVWCVTLYNLLPEDEQEFHHYLNEPHAKAVDTQSIEKKYMADLISIQEYEDEKFPDRKRRKDEEAQTYPRPYVYSRCVICRQDDIGLIRCQNCANVACVDCIRREFLDPATKDGCFLLMHRKFCMRLGKLPVIQNEIVQEPAYLRELRETGRVKAIELLIPSNNKIEALDDDSVVVEEEDAEETEEEMRARLEAERIARENPPELQNFQITADVIARKKDKQRKGVLKYQSCMEESGHTDMFIQRQVRLKNECLEKCDKVDREANRLMNQVNALQLEGNFVRKCLNDLHCIRTDIANLHAMSSLAEYLTLYTTMLEESAAAMGIDPVAAAAAAAEAKRKEEEEEEEEEL